MTAAMTAFALVGTASVQAQTVGGQAESAVYIVQMAGDPVASYRGGIPGISATKAAPGAKANVHSPDARALRDRLRGQHGDALRRAGVDASNWVYDYSLTFNGFAARLTSGQVASLKATPGVVRVWRSQRHTADTLTTPGFLGLTGPAGAWTRQFGDVSRAGEGVIVGVLDSGFTPENASFGALSEPRPDQAVINAKWKGSCDPGVSGTVTCNNKVIGSRFFNEAGLGIPAEFKSPRDFNGHGSHTASTAAGNHNVSAAVHGLAVGNVSGIAPAARLAIYKVLWATPDGRASGDTFDIVAAVEAAADDGVDVINYSISGSQEFIVDPVELAFLGAADLGVFVSTSAGNNGDDIGESSVAHNAPWTSTASRRCRSGS